MFRSRSHTVFGAQAVCACLAAAFALLAGAAQGQQAPAATQAEQTPAATEEQPQPKIAPPVESNRSGFIDAFGRWIETSVGNWNSGIKGAADVAKDAAGAATDAAKGAGN